MRTFYFIVEAVTIDIARREKKDKGMTFTWRQHKRIKRSLALRSSIQYTARFSPLVVAIPQTTAGTKVLGMC